MNRRKVKWGSHMLQLHAILSRQRKYGEVSKVICVSKFAKSRIDEKSLAEPNLAWIQIFILEKVKSVDQRNVWPKYYEEVAWDITLTLLFSQFFHIKIEIDSLNFEVDAILQ